MSKVCETPCATRAPHRIFTQIMIPHTLYLQDRVKRSSHHFQREQQRNILIVIFRANIIYHAVLFLYINRALSTTTAAAKNIGLAFDALPGYIQYKLVSSFAFILLLGKCAGRNGGSLALKFAGTKHSTGGTPCQFYPISLSTSGCCRLSRRLYCRSACWLSGWLANLFAN